MYRHILIPTDGSELAQQGVAHGLALARMHGARVTAVTVTEMPDGQFAFSAGPWERDESELAAYEQEQVAAAEAILSPIRDQASRLGLKVETVHVPDRLVAAAILETAHDCGCDVIVMASHGRTGFSKALLGSQAAEVLARATTPVVLVR